MMYSKESLAAALACRRLRGPTHKIRVVKLITLGAPGVGKSFLLNLVKGEHVFEHEMQASPVTLAAQYALFDMDETVYVLCNVPGLETGARQASNARCIEEAFHVLEEQPNLDVHTAVMFVVGGAMGGRLDPKAVQAHEATLSYLGQRRPIAALVQNGVARSNLSTAIHEEIQKEGERLMGQALRMCLIEEVDACEVDNFMGAPMQRLRQHILGLVGRLGIFATRVQATQGRFVTPEEVECERNTAALEAMKHAIAQENASHARRMAEESARGARQLAALRK